MRKLVVGVVMLVALVWSADASAKSVSALSKTLRTASDFRVRAQAALKLGTTGSRTAVQPLCRGLKDDSRTVRAAAAAALGKLHEGGKNCLEARLKRESQANVKKMIRKALRLLAESESGPSLSGRSKYYVKIRKVRGKGTVDSDVRSGIRKAASKYRGYVFAPSDESRNQAKKRLRKHPKVIGLSFWPTVAIKEGDGRLEVRFVLSVKSYPDNAPIGRIMRAAGFSGVEDDEVDGKRTQLIDRLTKEAMQEFNQLARQL